MTLNQSLFQWIYGLSHRNVFADNLGIFLAAYLPYLLLVGFFILIYAQKESRRRWMLFIEGALATLLARGIITELIRYFYTHPRPFDVYGFSPLIPESGNSFPSGHMTFYFALAMVMLFWSRRWGVRYLVLALLIGLARIYAGVHWPLDILGGALIGILSGFATHAALRRPLRDLVRKPAIEIDEVVIKETVLE